MSVQNAFDEAGIGFTKMDDGLLLSSVHSASPRLTVTEMAHSCADKITESGAEPDSTSISDCVRAMLKEFNK